ncbi:hypothetical protein XVE_4916 [Xanthomonas vesicatoria ATCC 35937]|uniref:Uncharacterized protein n=1 Tax=Xanthomonas vesicatoria ATCC 35937 TaxID=925775 RepID=F0BKU9_9XANT|nr:hypothetical protein XVE_4916 [Xanthomonas vesicatoria ATCC 35937]
MAASALCCRRSAGRFGRRIAVGGDQAARGIACTTIFVMLGIALAVLFARLGGLFA